MDSVHRGFAWSVFFFLLVTLGLADCQSYQNSPPVPPCGGCSTGERCCLDEGLCWPVGEACPCEDAICDSPPAPRCADETTLRVYDDTGTCQAGACVYGFEDYPCEVGICFDGACLGGCALGGCVSDADCDDANPCTAELCRERCCYSSRQPDGLLCDDGDECTAGDVCQNGQCRGLAVPGCLPCQDDSDCDDGDPCTRDLCEGRDCRSEPVADAPVVLPSYSMESSCPGFGPLSEVWFRRVDRCSYGLFYNDGWFEAGDVCSLRAAPGGGSTLTCAMFGLGCDLPAAFDPWRFSAWCGGCELRFTADQACYRNVDCSAGRSCQVFLPSAPAAGIVQECGLGAGPGFDNTGATCTRDAQCFSVWCLPDQGTCHGLCITDADCQAMDPLLVCVDAILEDGAAGWLDFLRRCLPAP